MTATQVRIDGCRALGRAACRPEMLGLAAIGWLAPAWPATQRRAA